MHIDRVLTRFLFYFVHNRFEDFFPFLIVGWNYFRNYFEIFELYLNIFGNAYFKMYFQQKHDMGRLSIVYVGLIDMYIMNEVIKVNKCDRSFIGDFTARYME